VACEGAKRLKRTGGRERGKASVLRRCVAMCCSVLQCVALWCSVIKCLVSVLLSRQEGRECDFACCSVLQSNSECCSVL